MAQPSPRTSGATSTCISSAFRSASAFPNPDTRERPSPIPVTNATFSAPAPAPAPASASALASASASAPAPTPAPAQSEIRPRSPTTGIHLPDVPSPSPSSPPSPLLPLRTNEHDVAAPAAAEPMTSPPYWQASHAPLSRASSARSKRLIRLTDNEATEDGLACWAKSARIENYTLVSSPSLFARKAGTGSYVVYNCEVQTLSGASFKLRKRYSEFLGLHADLAKAFPSAGKALPNIPRKTVFHRFEPSFLEKRRVGLAHFLNCVLLNPEFSSSPIVKEFLFER